MKNIIILITLLSLLFLPTLTVHAAGLAAEPVQDFDGLLTTFFSLSGIAMLIAALINILKTVGVVKDGNAAGYSAALNLVALLGLFVFQATGQASLVPALDEQAGGLAQVLVIVFAYVWQLFISRSTHTEVIAGLPVIGTTFSNKSPGETIIVIDEE